MLGIGSPCMVRVTCSWTEKSSDKKTIFVPRAAVSIVGGIQPEILRMALGRKHYQDGLAARILMAMPPAKKRIWTEDEIDEALEAELSHLFDQLFGLQPTTDSDGQDCPAIVNLGPQAKEIWIQFYRRHQDEAAALMGDLAAAWSKLEGYAARIALVIHLTRWAGGETVDPNTIDRGEHDVCHRAHRMVQE